jgi:hypothetical protein
MYGSVVKLLLTLSLFIVPSSNNLFNILTTSFFEELFVNKVNHEDSYWLKWRLDKKDFLHFLCECSTRPVLNRFHGCRREPVLAHNK